MNALKLWAECSAERLFEWACFWSIEQILDVEIDQVEMAEYTVNLLMLCYI